MFSTHELAEIRYPSKLLEPGEKIWSYIQRRLHTPWFHVTYEFTYSEGAEYRRIVFITEVNHLLEIKNWVVRIISIDLVSPGYLNNSDHWKMEPLKEIWQGIDPGTKNKQKAYVFVLKDNSRYTDSALDTTEEKLLSLEKIFSPN